MLTITNMAMMQNFKVVYAEFKTMGIYTRWNYTHKWIINCI